MVSIPVKTAGIFALAALIAGCDGGETTIQLQGGQVVAPVPDEIRQVASLAGVPLQFQVTVNDEVVREVPVGDGESVSTVVNLRSDRSNEISVAWLAIDEGTPILLADFTTLVAAGAQELNISNYNSTGSRFDLDQDGRNNLSEARENRNMQSRFDLEVPLLTDFGGVFASIESQGVDPDTSGEPREQDPDSTFSLRHDGNNLIVYLCGRDQALQSDNSDVGGDGQYWHDDTVFVFIDGADSDSTSYDGIDDFQFAFVRGTGEMIVSKGAGNQFCPMGSCVSHTFFSNSTSCEYELTVSMSLADLNISLDSPVGFDIEITDDDNGGLREGSGSWIGFEDRSNEDPATFGTIRLN